MRQNLLSILVLFAIANGVQAQITKGSILPGGQFNFLKQESSYSPPLGTPSENKISNIYLQPVIGYAIRENVVMGAGVTYWHIQNKNELETVSKFQSTGANLFGRKYFPVLEKLFFFGESGISFNKIKKEDFAMNNLRQEETGWNARVYIFPGVAFRAGKRILLELSFNEFANLQYEDKETKVFNFGGSSSKATSNNLSFNSNLSSVSSIYIGFRLIFP